MKKSLLTVALVAIGACASGANAHADAIPYGAAGTVNLATYTFTANFTGELIGYFYSFNAGDTDSIAMSVDGGTTLGPFGLVNQTSPIASSFDFGPVVTGQTITFVLRNSTTSTDLSSDPTKNADLTQHIYSTDYTATGSTAIAGIPPGTFVSFEDLLGGPPQNSDFDYNDDAFVFPNLSVTTGTPIPGALPLFATGLGVMGLLVRRRKRKNAVAV
jgi:hypothetical protein